MDQDQVRETLEGQIDDLVRARRESQDPQEKAAASEAIAKLHPIPRLGEAEDAAALADFLLSDASGWITSQVIGVDGGRSSLRGRG